METDTQTGGSTAAPDKPEDPRFGHAKRVGQGEEGREMLEHVAMGAELTDDEERSALDWLLGDPQQITHDIPVDFETPEGMRKLTFVLRKSDPRLIDKIERANVQQSTGRMDTLTADFQIVSQLCDEMTDPSGKVVKFNDPRFTTIKLRNRDTGVMEDVKFANPAEALERRMRGQEGVITLVAAEIRRLCGYDPNRLGTSQRRLVEASLG